MVSLRLLPLTIFVAALLLTVKIGDVWTGYRQHQMRASLSVSESQAQTPPAQAQGQQRAQQAQTPPAQGQQRTQQAPAPPAQPTTPVQTQQTQPSRPIGQGGQAAPAQAPAAQAPAQPAPQPPQATAKQDNKPLDPIIFSQSEIEILQNLASRRKEIDSREEAVVKREVLLQAAEKRLEDKIGELRQIRGEIEGLIRKYNDQEENELKSLVKIYETMKPKDAARIFDELDLKVLLQVFQRMKEAKTAPILASMNPARAKEVTTQLAERKEIPSANQ